MVAAQMIAVHTAAMESFHAARDATYPNTSLNYFDQAGKLCRTFAMLLDALNRHRGKGQQKITVEHVHVHPGGQAVVGVVEAGGGLNAKTENQGHGKGKPRARFHRGEEIGIRWHHPEELLERYLPLLESQCDLAEMDVPPVKTMIWAINSMADMLIGKSERESGARMRLAATLFDGLFRPGRAGAPALC